MKKKKIDIELLVSAFAYSFASMNQAFYLRKRDLKVIEIHILDYSLVSECKTEYESGMTKEQERDIKEAIIADEKNYNTHILIPRLTKEQRFDIISDFINSTGDYREKLVSNYKLLVDSTKNYGVEFYKKGIRVGLQMEYLTNEIEEEGFKSKWTEFYRDKTKVVALEWLRNEIKDLKEEY